MCNLAQPGSTADVLTRLICVQHCPVILTDHNHVVLRVLEQNAALNKGSHSIKCMHLDWGGDSDALANILLQSPDRQVDTTWSLLHAPPALLC